MLIPGAFMTVLSAVSGVMGIHSFFTGMRANRQQNQLLADMAQIKGQIEKLTDNVFYASAVQQVHSTTEAVRTVTDLRELRQVLEPVQQGLDAAILSTAMLTTPARLQQAFRQNPWQVLDNITPVDAVITPKNPAMVPVLFFHRGVFYIGWQMIGALPQLFGCDYSPDNIGPEPIGQDWILIPANAFTMGSPNNELGHYPDETQHRVRITRPFLMKRTAVTVGEYQRFRKPDMPSFNQTAEHPVVNVTWHDAIEYCAWLSAQERLKPCYSGSGDAIACDLSATGYRLPTEAEWEYACRAGTDTPFNTGANITTDQANYDGNYPYGNAANGTYRKGTVPVGSLPPNNWGLCEMHGNVWEWCWDWYDSYANSPPDDPEGPDSGAVRVLRGGSWVYGAGVCRSADRGWSLPGFRYVNDGFRVVRRAPQD